MGTRHELTGGMTVLAIAAVALVYDPKAPAAVAKTAGMLLFAVVFLALALPAIVRAERTALTAPLGLFTLLVGELTVSMAWSEHALPLSIAPLVASAALAWALTGLPRASVALMGARVAMLVGVISSASAIASRWSGSKPHGGHGNPDWLGLVLVAALPLIIAHAARIRGAERWLAALAVAVAAVGLLLSGSRSAWAGGAVAAAVMLRGRWRAGAIFAAALGAALVVWRTDFGEAFGGRVWIWQNALDAALDRPLLGVGTGRFAFAFLDAQGAALAPMPLDHASVTFVNAQSAHDDWLHLFVEGGVAAPLLALAALASAAWQLRDSHRGAAAAVVAVAVSGIGDVALLQPGVLVLVTFAFAGCPRLVPRRGDGVMAVVLLIALAALLPGASQRWLGQRRLAEARELSFEKRVAPLEHAARTASSDGDIALELGLAYAAIGDEARALDWLERSSRTLANVGTHIAIGNARLAVGDDEGALRAFRTALRYQPARLAAHVNLAECARRLHRLDLARHHLRAAEELQPNHPKLAALRERLRRAAIEAATRE